ncbi:hypothetical protein lbkm_2077 [Lachnospiraceae bacterium KM106-2]|nr:hypothetical protein lbkm_2077 [Lachnospiraceae bacterium KM106-2]
MLDVKKKEIQVIELEDNFVIEIHDEVLEGEAVVEVWVYNREYSTKIHAFSIMKEDIESPIKLYKHIEEHKQEYLDAYQEEVMDEE